MKLIVFRNSTDKPIRLALAPRKLAASVVLAVLTLGAVGFLVGNKMSGEQRAALTDLREMRAAVTAYEAEVERLQTRQQDDLAALALRLGDIQARATRIEALGERLTQLGQLQDGEFDFRSTPALGGPMAPRSDEDDTLSRVGIESALAQLDGRLEHRQRQLDLLGELLTSGQLEATLEPSGRPVRSGWLSSGYGRRIDPFTGKKTAHPGIDFSGKAGAEVVAVAAGVVTWSGLRSAYGNTVDIDHGNGYVTRYAHNQQNLVSVGDRVEVGQTIALMGSTGRSTAPHVHFEVLKQGKRVNPTRFVSASR